MKCEAIEELLSRYLTDELSVEQKGHVQEHLKECVSCREALAFHRSLSSQMDAVVAVPSRLQDRMAEKVAAPRPAWLTRIFGDPTMKKILISSTAVTAMLAAAIIMTPRAASASTPTETFNKMRAALAMAMQNGELTLYISSDNKGTITVEGTLDGAPLPKNFPLLVHSTIDGNIIDVEVTADLAPANYSKIAYGKDHNTLELVPKAHPKTKTEIVLDPKSLKPKTWTTLQANDGLWEMVSKSEYEPKPSVKPAPKADTTIHAHVKMYVGGNASISAKNGG